MKNFRTFILLASIVLLSAAILLLSENSGGKDLRPDIPEFGFIAETEGRALRMNVFSSGDGYILFCPSNIDKLTLDFSDSGGNKSPVCADIAGKLLHSGDSLSLSSLGAECEMKFYGKNDQLTGSAALRILRGAALPSVFISSGTGEYSKVLSKKQNEFCRITISDADGAVLYSSADYDVIRGHGNTTWDAEDVTTKKSYNIYLHSPSDLFSMGASKEWVLLSNIFDPSNLRNKLVYDTADHLGLPFSPECRFVDLYLDGEYRGLYLLCEKVSVGSGRVDIGEDSVMFTMEVGNRIRGRLNEYTSPHGQNLVLTYPETNKASVYEDFYRRMDALENVFFSDFTMEELEKVIDAESWIKKGIIEEVFNNYDSWAASQYFYIPVGSDKVYAGPVWDYDTSSGNSLGKYLEAKIAAVNQVNFLSEKHAADTPTPWFFTLMKNSEFFESFCRIYSEEISPGLGEYIDGKIDEYNALISDSAKMDAVRWAHPGKDYVLELKDYMKARIAFLDRLLVDREPFHTVTFSGLSAVRAFFKGESCDTHVNASDWYFDEAYSEKCPDSFCPEEDLVLRSKELDESTDYFGHSRLYFYSFFLCLFMGLTAADIMRRAGGKHE